MSTLSSTGAEPLLDLDSLVLPSVQSDLLIREPDSRTWLTTLPRRVATACENWEVTPEKVLHGGRTGCVLKVRTPAVYGPGHPLVLKFALSSARARAEAAAMSLFAASGASPAVHRVDPEAGALLMDWVDGEPLRTASDSLPSPAALVTMADLLRRLRTDNSIGSDLELAAVPTLAEFHSQRLDNASTLREVARGSRPPTPANLNRARATLRFLLASGNRDEDLLLHGDLNTGNVLTGPQLLAIDPRPLRGDPAYDTAVLALKLDEKVAEKTARLLAAVTGDNLERVLCWLFVARVSRV